MRAGLDFISQSDSLIAGPGEPRKAANSWLGKFPPSETKEVQNSKWQISHNTHLRENFDFLSIKKYLFA